MLHYKERLLSHICILSRSFCSKTGEIPAKYFIGQQARLHLYSLAGDDFSSIFLVFGLFFLIAPISLLCPTFLNMRPFYKCAVSEVNNFFVFIFTVFLLNLLKHTGMCSQPLMPIQDVLPVLGSGSTMTHELTFSVTYLQYLNLTADWSILVQRLHVLYACLDEVHPDVPPAAPTHVA